MFTSILAFFRKPTPEEDFQRGIRYVESKLKVPPKARESVLRALWGDIDYCFDPTEFDKGIKHRLLQEDCCYPRGPL